MPCKVRSPHVATELNEDPVVSAKLASIVCMFEAPSVATPLLAQADPSIAVRTSKAPPRHHVEWCLRTSSVIVVGFCDTYNTATKPLGVQTLKSERPLRVASGSFPKDPKVGRTLANPTPESLTRKEKGPNIICSAPFISMCESAGVTRLKRSSCTSRGAAPASTARRAGTGRPAPS